MRCGDVEKHLPAYVSGELSVQDARQVEQHVALCDRCRASFVVYQVSLNALRRSRRRQIPKVYMQNFWPNVQRRIRLAERAREERVRRILEFLRWLLLPRVAWAACAVAGVLLMSWFLWTGGSARPPARVEKTPGQAPSVAETARPSVELPFTPVAKVRSAPTRFFALSPLDRVRRVPRGQNFDVLHSAVLGEKGASYALPSARLASVDE